MPANADAETIQTEIYAVGKAHFEENLRGWFQALYEILLGQDQGPRFGSFAALYGLAKNLIALIAAIKGVTANCCRLKLISCYLCFMGQMIYKRS